MPWILLLLAGLFEIGWAIGLKYTEGFTRLWPSLGTIAAMVISLGLLGLAMKSLPVAPPTRCGWAWARWAPRSSASCCWASRQTPGASPACCSSSPASSD